MTDDAFITRVIWVASITTFAGLFLGASCRPTPIPNTAAEAAYGAALLRCVDDATTLAESKACRARVDHEWGIVQTETKP